MGHKNLDLAALLKIPYVEPDIGYDLSPDGSKVAFSWNKSGQWEIYALEFNGSDPPKMLTGGVGGKVNPKWSPDGQKLAYMLDLTGSESFDIYLYDPVKGTHTNLTPDTKEAIGPYFNWSPDGNQLSFCCNRDGTFDTFIMPASGGKWVKVLGLPYPEWVNKWSPDGKTLLVLVEGAAQDIWTYFVPLDGSEPYSITLDGEKICAKDACYSPDGKQVVFSSNVMGAYDIGIWDMEGKSITWLTKDTVEHEHPDWSPDGSLIAYVNSSGPSCELAVYDIHQQRETTYQIEPGALYQPHFSPDGKQVFLVFDNPRHPDDLWSFDIASEQFQQLTQSLPTDIDPKVLCLPQEVWYTSHDGTQVPALLYKPEGDEALSAVIYIHGGPNWLIQFTWDPLVQHMVSRGWVVLAPNYRGSTGYGKEWQLASRFDLGGVDTQDVVSGAIFLAEEGIAQSEKIGITGRSWGGYLTMTCLTQYPDVWAAGAAVVPFLNWFTSHANSRDDLRHWDIENFGRPDENHDLWHERSPYFFLDKILAPVQLVCGAYDVRCPASESKQAFEELQRLGKECEYLLYEDEGHAFLKTENQIDSKQKVVNFLAKYLDYP